MQIYHELTFSIKKFIAWFMEKKKAKNEIDHYNLGMQKLWT